MAFTVAFTVGQTPLRGVSGLPSRASLPRVGARQGAQAPARHRLVVVAARKPERPFRTVLPGLVQGTDALFRKYDFVSTGLGALCVTSFCVYRGQDPLTAMYITLGSTLIALAANELWWHDDS